MSYREEFHAAVTQMLFEYKDEVTMQVVDDMFRTVDESGDGSIQLNEFQQWYSCITTSVHSARSAKSTGAAESSETLKDEPRSGAVASGDGLLDLPSAVPNKASRSDKSQCVLM
jgi:hypothetical protein